MPISLETKKLRAGVRSIGKEYECFGRIGSMRCYASPRRVECEGGEEDFCVELYKPRRVLELRSRVAGEVEDEDFGYVRYEGRVLARLLDYEGYDDMVLEGVLERIDGDVVGDYVVVFKDYELRIEQRPYAKRRKELMLDLRGYDEVLMRVESDRGERSFVINLRSGEARKLRS